MTSLPGFARVGRDAVMCLKRLAAADLTVGAVFGAVTVVLDFAAIARAAGRAALAAVLCDATGLGLHVAGMGVGGGVVVKLTEAMDHAHGVVTGRIQIVRDRHQLQGDLAEIEPRAGLERERLGADEPIVHARYALAHLIRKERHDGDEALAGRLASPRRLREILL